MRYLLFAILALLSLSCSRKQYVPLESTRADSTAIHTERILSHIRTLAEQIRITERRRDSIATHRQTALRDCTVLTLGNDGTLISRERYRDTDTHTDRATSTHTDRIETLTQTYLDSVAGTLRSEIAAIRETRTQTPVPVERPTTAWERTVTAIGHIAIGAVAVLLILGIIRFIRRLRSRK